ncbi:MAG: hypothetical protein HQK50_08900 [Oligoflexia bacterium]|nr:hypothetical protein [Oligoflexia bacterium]MBF0365676.1 hypothetical protein [Oligoflexia bacterium]
MHLGLKSFKRFSLLLLISALFLASNSGSAVAYSSKAPSLSLLAEADSTRVEEKLYSASTLYTPYLSVEVSDKYTVGSFAEITQTRDSALVDAISLRFDHKIYKGSLLDLSSSSRLNVRPSEAAHEKSGESKNLEFRGYANLQISDNFLLKNELRTKFSAASRKYENEKSQWWSVDYYLTPVYSFSDKVSGEVEFLGEKIEKRQSSSVEFLQMAPKSIYHYNSHWSSSAKLESKLLESQDESFSWAQKNLRLELGGKYVPSSSFDVEFLISSSLIKSVSKNFLLELNVNLIAF